MRTKKTPSKNVSIADVAKLAGVSITTVSRVINKVSTVKERHRSSVLEAVAQLHYHPSTVAQRLATGKSNVVALVIPRYEGMFYSFYVLELIRGIGTLCDSLKLDLLLHITDTHSNLDLRGAGGAIFADILGNRHQLDETLAAGIPCVVVNHIVEDRKVSCISIDNTGGAEAAVDYLASLGHKKIAHIAGDFVAQSAQERLQGYKKSLEKNQLPFRQEYVFKTDYSRGQARQAAEKLLNMQEPPSAVFIASDSMALEVMAVAKEAGKDIPRDLSVVGFDDNPSGLYGPVALTTVRQPLLKMAQEAVGQLKAIMGAEDKTLKPKRIILPAELVIRESCRPLGD